MLEQSNLTTRIIELSAFRSILGYMDDTVDWFDRVGERENVFARMLDDARLSSLVSDRKAKALQSYGSFTSSGNSIIDKICEKNLDFNLFYKLNNILLNAVPFGIACAEILWGMKDGLYVPVGFTPIPRTALSFNSQDPTIPFNTPILTSINLPLSDKSRFVVHRNDDGNGNAWGKPVLRSAYWAWKFKSLGFKFWVMAAEKIGVPTILALFETTGEDEGKKRADQLAAALQDWESASAGALGNVKDLKVIDSRIQDFNILIETCNAELAYAITSQSLATNQAQYGTKAQAVTHTGTYEANVKNDLYLLQQSDQQVVDAFVQVNFPGEKPSRYDIDSTDYMALADVFGLIDRGVPVSLDAIYNKYHAPRPKGENDSFVKQNNGMLFNDNNDGNSFFFRR